MHDPNCIFCKIVDKKIPAEIVYENEDILVMADIKPVNLGHVLVLSKKHFVNIYDIPNELLSKLIIQAKATSEIIKKALGDDGVNVHMNNELPAGQVVFHAHIHVIPRFEGDGFTHWKGQAYSQAEIKNTAEKIRSAMSV